MKKSKEGIEFCYILNLVNYLLKYFKILVVNIVIILFYNYQKFKNLRVFVVLVFLCVCMLYKQRFRLKLFYIIFLVYNDMDIIIFNRNFILNFEF